MRELTPAKPASTADAQSLHGSGLALAEKRLRLRERGLVLHRREELARLAERRVRLQLAEGSEAASLTEEGVGAFGHVPELTPALGRFVVELGGVGVLISGFGELRLGRGEGVFVERGVRFDFIGQPLGDSSTEGVGGSVNGAVQKPQKAKPSGFSLPQEGQVNTGRVQARTQLKSPATLPP